MTKFSIYHIEGIGDFYIDDVNDFIKEKLKKGEAWEPHIVQALEKYIVPATTVVDIGAYIGTHTIKMSQCIGEKGSVIAFEPQKRIFSELGKNIKLNKCNNVRTFRYALGNINFKQVEMNPTNRFNAGATSIGSGGDLVTMRTLDSMKLSHVSLIKIDVEGHEYSVLKGAEETILRNQPTIVFECWTGVPCEIQSTIQQANLDRVLSLLKSYGYEIHNIYDSDFIAFPNRNSFS